MALLRHSMTLGISTGISLLAMSLHAVDHIVLLSMGGRGQPSNMQWLSKDTIKDKTKRDLRP